MQTTFLDRINSTWHERALQGFMVIVLAHWAEHLLQAFQIYGLGWPVPEARGALGYFFPYLVTSEMLHYGYALVMLVGLWMLRSGFTGVEDRRWWTIALAIQFFHHIEHFLLQGQYLLGAEPARPARADEPRPVVGAARGAAPLLQHHRVHPDDGRDVLPHVPASRSKAAEVHLRVAQAACRDPARLFGCRRRLLSRRLASPRAVDTGVDVTVGMEAGPPGRGPRPASRASACLTPNGTARSGATLRLEAHMSHPGHDACRDAGLSSVATASTKLRSGSPWPATGCLSSPAVPGGGRFTRTADRALPESGRPSSDRWTSCACR